MKGEAWRMGNSMVLSWLVIVTGPFCFVTRFWMKNVWKLQKCFVKKSRKPSRFDCFCSSNSFLQMETVWDQKTAPLSTVGSLSGQLLAFRENAYGFHAPHLLFLEILERFSFVAPDCIFRSFNNLNWLERSEKSSNCRHFLPLSNYSQNKAP